MKNYLLWLLILLVLLQAYTAFETGPEFHVVSHDAYLKQLEDIKRLTNGPQDIVNMAYYAYFNGRYGEHLVNYTLILDVVMLLLLIIAIKKRHSSSKNPLSAPKVEGEKRSDSSHGH